MVAVKSEFVVAQCGVTGCWGIVWISQGGFSGFLGYTVQQVEDVIKKIESGMHLSSLYVWYPCFMCEIDVTKYLEPLEGPFRFSTSDKCEHCVVDHETKQVAPIGLELGAKQIAYFLNAGWRNPGQYTWVDPPLVGLTWGDFDGDERGGDPSPRIDYTPSDN